MSSTSTLMVQPPPFTVPFVDSKTGLIDTIWQLWLLQVFGGQNATASSASGANGAAATAQNTANSAASAAAAAQATANAAATNANVAAAVLVETTRAESAESLLAPKLNPTFSGTVTEPVAVLTGATPAVSVGQLGLGMTTSATATGGAGTLPAAPVAFIVINVAGTTGKIPYYAT
jgi:hypothetical protein